MGSLKRILHLGIKELRSLRFDPVLMLFIVYAFTLDIINATDQSIEVRNARVAIVDEDGSQIAQRISQAIMPPRFQPPVRITTAEIDRALDSGRYTFVIDIPPRFQADLVAGKRPTVQINVDATAVGQAFAGLGYLEAIITQEVAAFRNRPATGPPQVAAAAYRIKYNQNMNEDWFNSVGQLLLMVTVLSMLLPAAALLREQERGTISHLLAMPISPAEIMLSKIWANALVVQIGCLVAILVILQGVIGVPIRGSIALFLFGTLCFQFAATAIGMLLATLVRTVPQFVLLMLVVITPMIFLSGTFTPGESMPESMRVLMAVSPLRYYTTFSMSVLFRDADILLIARELAIMLALGAVLFAIALRRFRAHFSLAGK